MPKRKKLPSEHESVRQELCIHTTRGRRVILVEVGYYDDKHTIGEVFLDIAKTGSNEKAWCDEVCIGASYSLQQGRPLEEVIERWRQTKFDPCGPVTGHPSIKFCSSPLDAVAQFLEAEQRGEM